jgi:hypothetical protein
MKRFLMLGLLLVAFGCHEAANTPPPCPTGFVLPDGFPDNVDGFYGLVFDTCEYTQAEMNQLRSEMKNASMEIMACLDSVYNYDFYANSKDNIPVPYASKVQIVSQMFPGRDGITRHVQYLQAGYFIKYYPTKNANGTWNLQWWAGELHTMYRVEMLGSWDRDVVYDENLPFEKAATLANNACIRKWKP